MRHVAEVRRIIVREWLHYIADLNRTMKEHEEEIERCKAKLDLASMDYSRVMVTTSPEPDAMLKAVALLEEARQDYATVIAEYEQELKEAWEICHRAGLPECSMLWDYHVERMTWAQVGKKYNYAAKYVSEVARKGIDSIYDALPERTVRNVWREMEE